MAYSVNNYPNLYRATAGYELYGDPEAYLKWRGPQREAARIQVLEIIAPIYGEILTQNGLNLDDALNKSKMWAIAFGNGGHRIFAHNLLELAEIFEASLNVSAMHESVDYAMPSKMAQFVQKAHEVNQAGLNELANLADMEVPDNIAPAAAPAKSGWVVPVGLVVAALSLLG